MFSLRSILYWKSAIFVKMKAIEHYQKQFVTHLEHYNKPRTPKNLYAPIQYILNLGGKRLRPTLTLMSADCFNGDVSASLDAALAIEVFHNFSLIHDDIMDKAPLRRGQQTVHEKWDLNTGILSGDAMLILAYQLFESYNAIQFQQLTTLFSKTALEVCEGQQYDVDFETRFDVTIPEKPGAVPPARRPYPVAPHHVPELERQIRVLLDAGIIRPSASQYSAPVLIRLSTCARWNLFWVPFASTSCWQKGPSARLGMQFCRPPTVLVRIAFRGSRWSKRGGHGPRVVDGGRGLSRIALAVPCIGAGSFSNKILRTERR